MRTEAKRVRRGLPFLMTACWACGCGQAGGAQKNVSAAAIVGAAQLCLGGGRDDRIAELVRNDAESLAELFGSSSALIEGSEQAYAPTPEQVQELVKSAGTGRGLFFFYSGHGTQAKEGATLCLAPSPEYADGGLSIHRLLSALESNPPWALMVVNSCRSAYVDVREARRTVSVISVAHQDIPAAGFAGRGTLIGEHTAGVLNGQGAEMESVDQNCDGMVTDYELFSALVQRVRHIVGAAPNLRQRSHVQLPVALDGKSAERPACQEYLSGIEQLEVRLEANGSPEARRLREGLAQQARMAKAMAIAEAQRPELVPPEFIGDFFVVDPPDADLSRIALDSKLQAFPGRPADAQLLAEHAIFTEIYHFRRLDDHVGVIRMRGMRELGRIANSDFSQIVQNLSRRAWVTVKPATEQDPKWARAQVVTRFISQPDHNNPRQALHITSDYRELAGERESIVFDLSAWEAVPCDPNSDGQCFRRLLR